MEFGVRGDHITLGQLMKVLGEADAGGDVKSLLAAHPPRVNGEPEARRGRKLRPGDRVEFFSGKTVALTEAGESDEA